jgi:prepilin-type N-terminal cleavage/methylation domain-containing protein
MPITANSNRRGYTLIELMLVIVLVSLVLGSVAALLGGAFRANRTMQNHRSAMHAVQRLAEQFREDIHGAASVEAVDQKLAINLPEEKIAVYELKQNIVERTVTSAGKVVHRDGFDLPPGGTAVFETPASEGNRLASLIVTYPLGAMQPEHSDRRTLRIEAASGFVGAKTEANAKPPTVD